MYINPGPAVNQRQARAKGGLELPPAHRLAPRHRGRAKLGSERRENGGRGEKGKRREGGATKGGSENVQLHPQNYPARVKRTRSSAYRWRDNVHLDFRPRPMGTLPSILWWNAVDSSSILSSFFFFFWNSLFLAPFSSLLLLLLLRSLLQSDCFSQRETLCVYKAITAPA